ncbi:complex I subunit 5 family protein [Salinarimonas rosea]|uniref:complex I subunit 5 family protein n=1 Tax=Salinarimonas rosea TaxID=552063 RepID=UPI000412E733|nr:complex I subunit 5 family protein [Salinarimonas rosea]
MIEGPLLPFVALAWPLLLGALASLPAMRPRALVLLPLAPLPALLAAFLAPHGVETRAPDLLLGVVLALDPSSALLLGVVAALWMLAGVFALDYMRGTHKPTTFTGFWCLTLAGNLGVFLARDVATFYVCFAAVSLAAYILVVHEGDARALRAGRLYLALAVLGEAAILAGLTIGAAGAGSLDVAAVRAALGTMPYGDVASAGLLVGFGIKAGLVPLHVWLPLAHPAAPTPASAVLSGAIVKAGVFGVMLLVPFEALAPALWSLLVALGFAGAFLAVVAGLAQTNPKAILAYSTVSQMSLLLGALAASAAAGAPALGNAALYAAHQGLAKGALFLSVGVVAATTGALRRATLGLVALVALSIAGLPPLGGALAKVALKAPLSGLVAFLVTVSAATTALLLLHAWRAVAAQPSGETTGAAARALRFCPFAALSLAALVLPWIGFAPFAGHSLGYATKPENLWAGAWPVLLAGAVALLATRPRLRARLRGPTIPEGDLAQPLERAAAAIVAQVRRRSQVRSHGLRRDGRRLLDRAQARLAGLERPLVAWSASGIVLAALALATGLVLLQTSG